ncbi:glycosyltransferase [Gemmatimonadota bacterium]
MMRVKDENDWIEPSVRSIQSIADEIVIVDNGSTDGTLETIQRLMKEGAGNIELHQIPDLDLCSLSNFALEQTRYHWSFNWDGDMVAHTSGKWDISGLRDRLLALNPRKYHLIFLRLINLAGDLSHQDPSEMVHIEEYVHTYSESAQFIHPGRHEAVKFPIYYQPLFWFEPYAFHVNIKPADRMLSRYFWYEWMEMKEYDKYPTLEDYVRVGIMDAFGTDSMEEAQGICVAKVCRDFIRFNSKVFGPYPEMLEPYLENPAYTLLYGDGEIIGREERQ